jgi:hypothetical protein
MGTKEKSFQVACPLIVSRVTIISSGCIHASGSLPFWKVARLLVQTYNARGLGLAFMNAIASSIDYTLACTSITER